MAEEKKSSCATCSSTTCSAKNKHANENDEQFAARRQIAENLCKIKHKVIVMSGKGGVGKSSVAVNIAMALAMDGKNVGLLDIDLHGPSVPTMFGLTDGKISVSENNRFIPITFGGLKIMSVGFFLPDRDDAIIWRGPLKHAMIQQFFKDVDWGTLDYLIIDSPPGTGDELLSLVNTVEDLTGAVLVTTPQEVAAADVRKSVTFCEKANVKVLGIVENMSGYACPHCGEVSQIFKIGAGQKIAEKYGFPLLGKIPIDPAIGESGDNGVPFVYMQSKSASAKEIESITNKMVAICEKKD
ncbi:Mrp/NBP35 family ATP-binding protein [bacterium]|nr:Mrp/NBP35 family ATP-binding protein [bacterium]